MCTREDTLSGWLTGGWVGMVVNFKIKLTPLPKPVPKPIPAAQKQNVTVIDPTL